jgi:hypothetical protein
MNFKTATDSLFDRLEHADLADQLGVSVAAIRQARLDLSAKAHRSPPKDWERAVVELAENRIRHYHELIGELERGSAGSSSRPQVTALE